VYSLVPILIVFVKIHVKHVLIGAQQMATVWEESATVSMATMAMIVVKLVVRLVPFGILQLHYASVYVQASTIRIVTLVHVSHATVFVTSAMVSPRSVQIVLPHPTTPSISIMVYATLVVLMAHLQMVLNVLSVIQLYFARHVLLQQLTAHHVILMHQLTKQNI
jgi:hypothetical protein